MGIMQSSGGKGSSKRPLNVSAETYGENFDAIFSKKKVSEDEEHRINPDEHPLSKLLAGVPEDLYFNSSWVRDMCEEVNKALIELNKLK